MKIIYKFSFFLTIILMAVSGWYDVSANTAVVEYNAHLGYPKYFIQWLGFCKLIGVFLYFTVNFKKLQEWIFIGFFIDISSGLVSHIACNDPWQIIFLPAISLVFWLMAFKGYVLKN